VQPLYVSVQCSIFTRYPRRGEQVSMSNHNRTHHLLRLCGTSHINAFWMVHALSQALQLWLLHTLNTSLSFACFPRLPPNALFAWTGVDTPGVARLLYFLLHRRSFSSTHRYHKKIDTQQFQVAAVMGTSVLGLPIRDCEGSCNSSVPRCAKVSTIDVMKKTIFEAR